MSPRDKNRTPDELKDYLAGFETFPSPQRNYVMETTTAPRKNRTPLILGLSTAVAVAAIGIAGVSLHFNRQSTAVPPASASPGVSTPHATATPAPTAPVYTVVLQATTYTNAAGTASLTDIRDVSITNGVASNHTVISGQETSVLDANQGIALITTGHGEAYQQVSTLELATLNLQTGVIHKLGVKANEGIFGVLSPDGTQAAVIVSGLTTHSFDIVQLSSGATKQIGAYPQPNDFTWRVPVRWLANGILARIAGPEGCGAYVIIDPATGKSAPYDTPNGQSSSMSPNETYVAVSTHTALGDDQCQCQGDWGNTLLVGTVGGPSTQIMAEKNRFITALDVRNDGAVLFSVGGGVVAGGPNAPDSGIYLYSQGKTTELSVNRIYGTPQARFVGATQAVVEITTAENATYNPTSIDINLVTLCSQDGNSCRPTSVPVMTAKGTSVFVGVTIVDY